MKYLVEYQGRMRTVERVLLAVVFTVAGIAAPLGIARAVKVRQARAHFEKAEAFADQGEWQEAEMEFRASLKIDPAYFPSRDALASMAWARKDFDAAFGEYETARRLEPGSPEPLVALGQLHFLRHEFGAAIPLLEQALALAPSHHAAGKLLKTCRAGARGERVEACAVEAGCAHAGHGHRH